MDGSVVDTGLYAFKGGIFNWKILSPTDLVSGAANRCLFDF